MGSLQKLDNTGFALNVSHHGLGLFTEAVQLGCSWHASFLLELSWFGLTPFWSLLTCLPCCAQENQRRELLQMSDPQLADVARVCNRYPDIEVNFDVTGGETVTAGEPVHINVFMERTLPEGQELTPVHCPR